MDIDVIVVGAGPVGLTLAAELRLAGASPLVLETLAEPSRLPRARGVGPLAFEALCRRGLGVRLAAHRPGRSAEKARDHGSEKDHFAWIHKIDPLVQEEPDRRGALIWQPDLEAVLGDHAGGLGVPVRRGCTVVSIHQDEDGVTATVRTPAGLERLRTAFLVGCDGGHSTVRKLAGFDFPGTPATMTARQARVEIEAPDRLPPSGRTLAGMLIHGPGVLGTFDFGDGHETRGGPVTREELGASVRRVAGTDVVITRMSDALRFTDHARQAATYRSDRVLLAGDAAHVHSPNGGQGLNLGLMDAVNLGWKLAAEIRGTAPAGLLDSYTAERHPVGAAVLHNTRAQSALMRPGPHTDALRDIVSDLMDLEEVNRYFGRMLSGLAARYVFPYTPTETTKTTAPTATTSAAATTSTTEGGPGTGTAETHHPLLGLHCPDLELTVAPPVGGKRAARLSRFTKSGRSVLLAPAGSPAIATAAGWRDRLDVVEVESVGRTDLAGALVRPDGAVAWAAAPDAPADVALLRVALHTWLGA